MNNLKSIFKSKRFIAAVIITAVAVGIVSIQKKAAPVLDVDVDA